MATRTSPSVTVTRVKKTSGTPSSKTTDVTPSKKNPTAIRVAISPANDGSESSSSSSASGSSSDSEDDDAAASKPSESDNSGDGGDDDEGEGDDDGEADSVSEGDKDGHGQGLRAARAKNPIEAAVRKLKVGGKPNLKQLSIEPFTGRIEPGQFDSMVRAWWTQFFGQMLGAQLRDNHRWTELIKCSFLQALLKGDASRWFDRTWAANPSMTLKQAGLQLIRHYSTKIDEDAIRDKIRGASKQPDESYEMFSQRLQNMADSLPGGINQTTNAAAALSAFVKKACPSQTTQLDFWLSTQSRSMRPRAAMDKLVNLLGRLTKTDGVQHDVQSSKKIKTNQAALAATVVDRKRKNGGGGEERPNKYGPYVQPAWVNENTLCRKCKGRGHIARDPTCPKNGSGKPESPLVKAAMKATEEDTA